MLRLDMIAVGWGNYLNNGKKKIESVRKFEALISVNDIL